MSAEATIWTAIKTIGGIAVYPIVAIVGYLYTRQVKRLDRHGKDIAEIKTKIKVHDVQMLDVKQDIEKIDKKLDKILDKLSK